MPHTASCWRFVDEEDFAGTVRNACSPASMLEIGWRKDARPWFHDAFAPAVGVSRITLLEVFPPNVADMEVERWAGRFPLIDRVVEGDVTDPGLDLGWHDLVFWSHGPEHASVEALRETTPRLLESCRMLVYNGPLGCWPQGPEDGNEHERHLTELSPELFRSLGLSCHVTFGTPGPDDPPGEILGWSVKGMLPGHRCGF